MSTGSVCASCNEAVEPGRITMVKGLPYCNFCLARRGKTKSGGGGFSFPSLSLPSFSMGGMFSDAGGNKARMYKMIGFIALLVIIRVVLFFI